MIEDTNDSYVEGAIFVTNSTLKINITSPITDYNISENISNTTTTDISEDYQLPMAIKLMPLVLGLSCILGTLLRIKCQFYAHDTDEYGMVHIPEQSNGPLNFHSLNKNP